jgi:O-antigen/teichoic acid export membrane protein
MLKREFAAMLASNLLIALIGLGTWAIFLNVLKPEGQALLTLACFIPSILWTFCGLGQEVVNATFAGIRKDQRQALFMQTILVTIFSGVVGTLMIAAYFFLVPPERQGQFANLDPTVIWLSTLMVPATVLGINLSALVRGVGRITTSAVLQVVPSVVIFILALILLVGLRLGVTAAMALTVAGTLIGAVIPIWCLREYATLRPSVLSWELLKKSFSFGLQVCIGNLAMFLVYRINQGILGYMEPYGIDLVQIGLFAAAVALTERMRILPGSLGQAFLPRLANELAERQGQVPSVYRYSLVISIASMFAMAAAGVGVILLLLKPIYIGSIVPFLILLPGVAALGGASILASDLLTRGKPYFNTAIAWANLGLNVVLNLLLIPVMGIAGAALTSTICYGITLTATTIIYLRVSGVPVREMAPRGADWMFVWRGTWQLVGEILRWVLRRPGAPFPPPPVR